MRVAGPAAAISALRELPVIDAAWGFYFDRYVAQGWEAGFAPDDIFGGFGQLVAARHAELAGLRERDPEQNQSRWDTHPPDGTRIAAMNATPASAHPVDGRPAWALLPSIAAVGRALQAEVFAIGDREVLPWPQFTAAAVTSGLQGDADRIFRSLSRLTGTAQPGLGAVLDLVAAGRLGELAEEFLPRATRKEAPAQFAGIMDMLITLAAVRSGVVSWRHSWSEPAKLVYADGAEADFEELAKLAVVPETLDQARARMAHLGIQVEAAEIVERSATPSGSNVIGALVNFKVDSEHTDLILLDRGIILVPAPKSTDNGKERLRSLLGSVPVEQLAARHRFIPYEEVVSTSIDRRSPIRAELRMHGGATVAVEQRWTAEQLADSQDTLLAVLDRMVLSSRA